MAYCADTDFNIDPTRLAELTDSAIAVGVVDTTVTAKARQDASDFLDGLWGGKYVVPIAAVPSPRMARILSTKIATYYLYRRRDTMVIPDAVIADHKEAVALAKDIAAADDILLEGAIRVVAETGPTPTDGALNPVTRHFGRDLEIG